MTDKEILEALQSCTNGCIKKCPYDEMSLDYEKCMSDLMRDALDLINRQQAEIERLKQVARINANALFGSLRVEFLRKEARAEAIKEFVKAIEERLENNWDASWEVFHSVMGSIQELSASRGVDNV